MVSEQSPCGDGHIWQPFSDDELKALRSQARGDRPPGAWVDGAVRCERCGRTEARVSWFGQAHQVPLAPKQAGGPAVIHWPTRP
jgi:hypothetical protein